MLAATLDGKQDYDLKDCKIQPAVDLGVETKITGTGNQWKLVGDVDHKTTNPTPEEGLGTRLDSRGEGFQIYWGDR